MVQSCCRCYILSYANSTKRGTTFSTRGVAVLRGRFIQKWNFTHSRLTLLSMEALVRPGLTGGQYTLQTGRKTENMCFYWASPGRFKQVLSKKVDPKRKLNASSRGYEGETPLSLKYAGAKRPFSECFSTLTCKQVSFLFMHGGYFLFVYGLIRTLKAGERGETLLHVLIGLQNQLVRIFFTTLAIG